MTSLIYDIGQVTLTNGSTAIIGVGTAWEVNLVKGGLMTVEAPGGNPLLITSVEGDGAATAATKWVGPSGTYSYAISLASAQAAETVWASRQWARVVGDALLAGIVPDASGTLAERDALDPPLPTGKWFALAEADEDLEFHLKVPGGWRTFQTRGPGAEDGEPGVKGDTGDTGDMSYGVVVAVTDPEGTIQPGEYEIDDYVTTAGTMNIAFGRIRDGDPGAEVDFYVAVNGLPFYGPVTVEAGSQVVTDEAGIPLAIGDRVSLVVTAVIGDVRDFFGKIGIGAVS